MMHKIFGFLDNDLRYNLIIPLVLAFIVLCNVLGGFSIVNLQYDFPAFLFILYTFWVIMAMAALQNSAYEFPDFIEAFLTVTSSLPVIIILAVILITPAIIARIIFSEKRIKLYRILMISDYIILSVISAFYFISILIFSIMSFDSLFIFAVFTLFIPLPFIFITYCILKRGIKNTMSDDILNFCQNKAG